MNATLLAALIAVESGGRDQAIGDRHLSQPAVGALQIRQPALDDANRIIRTNWTIMQMTNRAIAIRVADAYLSHYGKGKSLHDLARIWNGGPNGHRRPSTLSYLNKIKRYL
jgi:hypothetical protein